ncbi:hypothetical protein H5410_045691 [Solanum commersonii]|uniref:Uncharacterized protein n=1 Tax=Solanum commersonii TaxID=4109 RepID=A0A9J5XA76_SOLCO|nr:hypothetical protein H5410_045691 [Solanum commersonii]
MLTHSLGHHSSGLGFATSLSRKSKTHGRMQKTQSQLGEDEILLTSSLPKNILSKLERKYPQNLLFYCENYNNEISAGGSLDKVSQGRRMTRLLFFLLSHHRLVLSFSIFTFWTIRRAECVPSAIRQVCLAMLRLKLLRSFQPFCSFLLLNVYASTKTSNT